MKEKLIFWTLIILALIGLTSLMGDIFSLIMRESNSKVYFQRGELKAQTLAFNFLKKNYGERAGQDYLNYLSVQKSGKNPQGIGAVLKR